MSGRADGKVVVVTGGARGLGAAHARRLVAEGAKVVIGDVLVKEGEALAEELGAQNALFVELDVTSEVSWQAAVARTEEVCGKVTGLVNNAGLVHRCPIEELTEADYRRVIDVNEIGVFLGMKAVLPSMRAAGGGSIVNISSLCGIIAFPYILSYTASKWAVRGMTKAAAQEFAPYNIRVNSVHPGVVATEMTADSERSHETVKRQPIQREAQPAEISNMVLYLLSDEASYSTGSEFVVDGGYASQ
ncbi:MULTISPECIES: glucose 1-dehydrogenase [unclassified Streptomyces]|uniref:glucose 1-dehydrogenase n=1 Tax=unclassified Streptomyces TaxID=2593676 RepID=UPI002252E068|nr:MULTISPECIES: glucose 1-dehydrogenase [unclassified Streptomyces]MCX4538130.1 glucose 1-dehydrogenase [Streptomyces sp. NBC_01669]WSA05295.1 glucose 1-dehydrogenase [Streptomyces sp. NBC_00841]